MTLKEIIGGQNWQLAFYSPNLPIFHTPKFSHIATVSLHKGLIIHNIKDIVHSS